MFAGHSLHPLNTEHHQFDRTALGPILQVKCRTALGTNVRSFHDEINNQTIPCASLVFFMQPAKAVTAPPLARFPAHGLGRCAWRSTHRALADPVLAQGSRQLSRTTVGRPAPGLFMEPATLQEQN